MRESLHENLEFNNDEVGNSSTAFSYEIVDNSQIFWVLKLGREIHNKEIHILNYGHSTLNQQRWFNSLIKNDPRFLLLLFTRLGYFESNNAIHYCLAILQGQLSPS